VDCNGNANGSASVSANGGVTAYSYLWNNGATTSTITGLVAGTYNVTTTDANGATSTNSVIITEPAVIVATAQTSQATCAGNLADGNMNALVSGGTAPYTYVWSNGSTASNVNGLTPGSYSVTVTDANGCTSTSSGVIATMCCNVTSAGVIAGTQSNCGSFNPTSITSTSLPSGGVGSVEYIWLKRLPGQNHTTISGATSSTYDPGTISQTTEYRRCARTVGCTSWDGESNWITMTVNSGITARLVYSNDATCYGTSTGSAKAKGTSGTSPFSYNWSNGANTQIVNNLSAGNYQVTITDANGCSTTVQATIGEPNSIMATGTVTDNTCNPGNYACNFDLSGYANGEVMTGAYASEGFTITSRANSGSLHDLIIFDTDLSGTRDPDLELNLGNIIIFPENNTDNNNDGIYDLPDDTPQGGTITFTFTNTRTVTSFDFVDKDSGSDGYAKAYDVNNTLIANQPIVNAGDGSVQTILLNAQDVKKLVIYYYNSGGINNFKYECPITISCDAAIDLQVSGGVAPYSYNWSNGETSKNISNLCVGVYDVTITDANGCSTVEQEEVFTPVPLAATTSSIDASCSVNPCGTSYKTIWAIDDQNSKVYYKDLANPNSTIKIEGNVVGSNNKDLEAMTIDSDGVLWIISNLDGEDPELYKVDNRDFDFDPFTTVELEFVGRTRVGESNAISGLQFVNGVLYGISEFTQKLYTINTSTGRATQVRDLDLNLTNYTSTTGDRKSSFRPEALTQAADGTMYTTDTHGDHSEIWKFNGTFPTGELVHVYTMQGSGKVEALAVHPDGTLYAGDDDHWYQINLNTNTMTTIANLDTDIEGMSFYFECEQTQVNSCDGSSTASVSGGVAPYSYNWSNGETTSSVHGLCVGNYSVTITDANGCTAVSYTDVDCDPNGVNNDANDNYNNDDDAVESNLRSVVFPNPSNGQFMLQFSSKEASDVTIVLYDMAGNAIDILFDGYVESDEITLLPYNSDRVSTGIYTIAITSNNHVTYEKLIIN
jgi:hypothetical protein